MAQAVAGVAHGMENDDVGVPEMSLSRGKPVRDETVNSNEHV